MRRAGLEALLLDTQYRMHAGIAAFPSKAFYGGKLQTGVSAAERPPPQVRSVQRSAAALGFRVFLSFRYLRWNRRQMDSCLWF